MAVRDFAQKLRLTAALLGCRTQKDLCLHFRMVNPDTEFDLERSYNWVRGRSQPRSARVYEDWATLLGTGRPSGFLTSCSIEEFHQVVAKRFGLSRTELASVAGSAAAASSSSSLRQLPSAYLAGAYACYSHALSPHYRGKLIRGSLVIEPDVVDPSGPSLIATYSESVAIGRVSLRGVVEPIGRSIYLDLSEADRELRVFMVLALPSPPAGTLAGVLLGAPFVDSFAYPAATRIVIVRVPGTELAALVDSERYLDPAEEPLSRDLVQLGMRIDGAEAAELDRLLEAFLGRAEAASTSIHMPDSTYAELTLAVDRLLVSLHDPDPNN